MNEVQENTDSLTNQLNEALIEVNASCMSAEEAEKVGHRNGQIHGTLRIVSKGLIVTDDADIENEIAWLCVASGNPADEETTSAGSS